MEDREFGRRVPERDAEDAVPNNEDDMRVLARRSKRSSAAYVISESIAVSVATAVAMAFGVRRLF